jgi:hypothetical protein
MNWDLDSPPGPWWGSPVDGELAKVDWYSEAIDYRRGIVSVPDNDLLFLYTRGREAIINSFGVVPLSTEVRRTEAVGKNTKAGFNNGRLAAIAGFGVSRKQYVGIDHTIEFSMMMPEQMTCHDLDLTLKTNDPSDFPNSGRKPDELSTEDFMNSKIAGSRRINLTDNLNWIESRKHKLWMGFNETCAYLHTNITNKNYCFNLEYDKHYCHYFENKPSYWTMEFSDDLLKKFGKKASLSVDGKKVARTLMNKHELIIPQGTGNHIIEVSLP